MKSPFKAGSLIPKCKDACSLYMADAKEMKIDSKLRLTVRECAPVKVTRNWIYDSLVIALIRNWNKLPLNV